MASTFTFKAIGTSWQVDISDQLLPVREAQILKKVTSRIEEFESAYSRFRPDSIVARIREKAGEYVMPGDFAKMFKVYKDLGELTDGLFTPLMGQLLSDAGYDPAYSLKEKERPLVSPPSLDDVLELDGSVLRVKEPVSLDFGAAGKGYVIDIIGELLSSEGISRYVIDAGGDILHKSSSTLRVGLENPSDFTEAIGIVQLQNQSLCASAGSRRKWGRFHHIINPKELSSPQEIAATWVVAESTMLADAIATCLFFVPAARLQDSFKFEYAALHSDRTLEKSLASRLRYSKRKP